MKNFEIVIIPLLVGIITQTVKFTIYSLRNGLDWSYIFTHGHMPSMHSALVTSLVVVVGYLAGVGSATFSLAVVLALIILDDALRVRMHLGDQGRYLNMLVETLNLDKEKYPRLKEHMGHRMSEVSVGVVLGVVLTAFFIFLFETVVKF